MGFVQAGTRGWGERPAKRKRSHREEGGSTRPRYRGLTSLPTELIQVIFSISLNDSLSLVCRHLHKVLVPTPHLEMLFLELLDQQQSSHLGVKQCIYRRFFSHKTLLRFEERLGQSISFETDALPTRLLSSPNLTEKMKLAKLLLQRGANRPDAYQCFARPDTSGERIKSMIALLDAEIISRDSRAVEQAVLSGDLRLAKVLLDCGFQPTDWTIDFAISRNWVELLEYIYRGSSPIDLKLLNRLTREGIALTPSRQLLPSK